MPRPKRQSLKSNESTENSTSAMIKSNVSKSLMTVFVRHGKQEQYILQRQFARCLSLAANNAITQCTTRRFPLLSLQ
jgi:predicted nucleic acid-binding Zn finger protein